MKQCDSELEELDKMPMTYPMPWLINGHKATEKLGKNIDKHK